MWLSDKWQDFELLDCSHGEKLERWGDYILFFHSPRSQRQAAPQGRHSPVAVTGRPSSRLSERPPKRFVKMLSLI